MKVWKQKNKNTKCPIDAHCHRHCRRDPRISKDFKDWIGAKTQLASRDLLGPGAPHEPIFVRRSPLGLLVLSVRASGSCLRSRYFSFWAWSPGRSLRSSKVMCDTKPKEVLFWNQCNPLILGSPLQWRWQWASTGHFVFLFACLARFSLSKFSEFFLEVVRR